MIRQLIKVRGSLGNKMLTLLQH